MHQVQQTVHAIKIEYHILYHQLTLNKLTFNSNIAIIKALNLNVKINSQKKTTELVSLA